MKNYILSLFIAAAMLAAPGVKAQAIAHWKLADLEAAIKNADRPTVFNFWATFCIPCIEELPYFQQAVKKYDSAGVRLVLVSLDLKESYPKKIQAFATKRKITAPIVFLDETNADLFCPVVDESWSGAIPASLFVNTKTGYRKFFETQLSKEEVEREIGEMIGRKEKQ
ncbi:MAG TPA: TlpA disulfide reductase family protein [Flavisolibacter sp.]|nr:TlpA disulfide reductase family protein [Flavisolibacter sp.]